MRLLYTFGLLIAMQIVALAQGPSRIAVMANTNGTLLTPTNFFRSNVVAGANITLAIGSRGELTIESSATVTPTTNFNGLIITNIIRGTNQDFYTTTNVPGGIMTWDWFTNLIGFIQSENFLVHGDTNDASFANAKTLTIGTNMVMWTNGNRVYIAGQPGGGGGSTLLTNRTILWVMEDGNDATAEAGRSDKPYGSFSNACEAVQNGQAIFIMQGRYTNNVGGTGGYQTFPAQKWAYRLKLKTNVLVKGIGNPSLCHTSQMTGLALDRCNGITLEDFTIQGRRETNNVLFLSDITGVITAHIEEYACTNVVIDNLKLRDGTAFGIAHQVTSEELGEITNGSPGIVVKNCYLYNFGTWMTNAGRYDGCGIASGSWVVQDCDFEEMVAGVEPYLYLAGGEYLSSRISRCRFKNMILAGIASSNCRLKDSIVDGCWFENVPGWDFGGTNPLPTVAAINVDGILNLKIQENHIEGFTNAFRFGTHCTNTILNANQVTNCIERIGGTSAGVVQDESVPRNTSGNGSMIDGGGLQWPDESTLNYWSSNYANAWNASSGWYLTPPAGRTNRTALVIGEILGLGMGIFWDDYDGTSWHTLSIYDTAGPDGAGSLMNTRSKTNFAEQFIASGKFHGDGSGLTNVTATAAGITNAISAVSINGTNLVASAATNLNLIAGANVTIIGTNSPTGQANVYISATAGVGDPGGTNSRQWGTATLTNLSASGITNWIGAGGTVLTTNNGAITFTSSVGDPGGTNSRQWGTATLTNLSASGITNWIGAGDVTLTTNAGAITFTGAGASGTNSRQWGTATLTNLSAAGITNWIGAGDVVLSTNAGAITFTGAGASGTNSRQWGTATLTNLSAAGITNWIGAGTVTLTTNNGAITFTGSGDGASNYVALWASNYFGTNITITGNLYVGGTQTVVNLQVTNLIVTAITNVNGVWATNLYVGGSDGWTNVLDFLTAGSAPYGSSSFIQFKEGASLFGTNTLTFNRTNDLLRVPHLHVYGAGNNDLQLGTNAAASLANSTSVGSQSSAANSATAVGTSASASTNGVAVGASVNGSGSYEGVQVGQNSAVTGYRNVFIGKDAGTAGGSMNYNVGVGYGTSSQGHSNTIIGAASTVGNYNNVTLLGSGLTAPSNNVTVISRTDQATMVAADLTVNSNLTARTSVSTPTANIGSGTLTNNILYLRGLTNIDSGTYTQLVVNFNSARVTISMTNGCTMTNFAGLEADQGTGTKYLDMLLVGRTNAMPLVTLPTFGGNSYGIHLWTNAAQPICVLITNSTRVRYTWAADGTNVSLVSSIWF